MLSDLTQLGHSSTFSHLSNLKITQGPFIAPFVYLRGSQCSDLTEVPTKSKPVPGVTEARLVRKPHCLADKCGLVIETAFSFLTLAYYLLSRPSPPPPPSVAPKTFLRHNHYHTTPNFYNSTQTLPLLPKVRIRLSFT